MHVHGHDVDQREHKHPYQIDEVPVQTTNFDVFMFQLIDPHGNNEKVNCSGRDVEHMQTGDGEKVAPNKGEGGVPSASVKWSTHSFGK